MQAEVRITHPAWRHAMSTQMPSYLATSSLMRSASPIWRDRLIGPWFFDAFQAIKHLRTDVIPPNFTCAVEGFDPDEWAAQNPDHAYTAKN
jgi:hypothetical protein